MKKVFTITELLAVIAIMVIILLMAVPIYQRVTLNINTTVYETKVANILCEGWITLFLTRTLSLKELRYPITSIIIKRSVIFNHISVINYYTFIVPKRAQKCSFYFQLAIIML